MSVICSYMLHSFKLCFGPYSLLKKYLFGSLSKVLLFKLEEDLFKYETLARPLRLSLTSLLYTPTLLFFCSSSSAVNACHSPLLPPFIPPSSPLSFSLLLHSPLSL